MQNLIDLRKNMVVATPILDSIIEAVVEDEDVETSQEIYNRLVIEFELTHTKIINDSLYVKDTGESIIHADEHKQHRVEHLVEQFPEHVHVLARGIGHRQGAAAVADHQAGNHHRQRARNMQMAGQGVPSHHCREREQDLDLILVHTA